MIVITLNFNCRLSEIDTCTHREKNRETYCIFSKFTGNQHNESFECQNKAARKEALDAVIKLY